MYQQSRKHWFDYTQNISDWWCADKKEILPSLTTKTKGVKGASGLNVGKQCDRTFIFSVWFPIVSRKSGKPSFCLDYRKPNAKTHMEWYLSHPYHPGNPWVPCWSHSGYWQLEMDLDSQAKTVFICPYSLYQFNVLPFGLKHALAPFQRLRNIVLRRLKGCTNVVFGIHVCDIVKRNNSFTGSNLETWQQTNHYGTPESAEAWWALVLLNFYLPLFCPEYV